MQINRLFEIIYLLTERERVTAKELAARFEVSTRTIYRDIDTLSSAGIPVYASQGKGGGISIMDNFVLNKTVISEEDQSNILLSLQSLAATEQVDTSRILGKLSNFFNKSATDWIEVDFSRWSSRPADQQKFQLLKEAILEQQIVSMEYVNAKNQRIQRKAAPLKLLFKANSWYLQAFCLTRQEHRIFKLNRIIQTRPDAEYFDPGKLPPCPEMSADYDSRKGTALKLKFSDQVEYRLFDEFAPDEISRAEDGSIIVSTDYAEDNWLYGYLLSFGPHLEILEPPHIRERLKSYVKSILKIYE